MHSKEGVHNAAQGTPLRSLVKQTNPQRVDFVIGSQPAAGELPAVHHPLAHYPTETGSGIARQGAHQAELRGKEHQAGVRGVVRVEDRRESTSPVPSGSTGHRRGDQFCGHASSMLGGMPPTHETTPEPRRGLLGGHR